MSKILTRQIQQVVSLPYRHHQEKSCKMHGLLNKDGRLFSTVHSLLCSNQSSILKDKVSSPAVPGKRAWKTGTDRISKQNFECGSNQLQAKIHHQLLAALPPGLPSLSQTKTDVSTAASPCKKNVLSKTVFHLNFCSLNSYRHGIYHGKCKHAVHANVDSKKDSASERNTVEGRYRFLGLPSTASTRFLRYRESRWAIARAVWSVLLVTHGTVRKVTGRRSFTNVLSVHVWQKSARISIAKTLKCLVEPCKMFVQSSTPKTDSLPQLPPICPQIHAQKVCSFLIDVSGEWPWTWSKAISSSSRIPCATGTIVHTVLLHMRSAA